MVSILITAWKEERTIGKAIETFVAGYEGEFEIILGCPDEETLEAATRRVAALGLSDKFRHFKDPGKGKPAALCGMMDMAKGDFWVFGDGDVYYGEDVINRLLLKFDSPEILAVSGRPRSSDTRDNMMGYFGHLLSDAAHHKRMIDLTADPQGRGRKFVKKRSFFPVSGYLFAMRRSDIRPAEDTLVDDAYISYVINSRGGKIAYAPEAEVFVQYPKKISDYFAQKKRSVGGYVQLWKYGFVNPENNTRSFKRELEYFWFPITYARSARELFWSLLLYPMRLWLWIKIFWERRIRHKSFEETWSRIESTK